MPPSDCILIQYYRINFHGKQPKGNSFLSLWGREFKNIFADFKNELSHFSTAIKDTSLTNSFIGIAV